MTKCAERQVSIKSTLKREQKYTRTQPYNFNTISNIIIFRDGYFQFRAYATFYRAFVRTTTFQRSTLNRNAMRKEEFIRTKNHLFIVFVYSKV